MVYSNAERQRLFVERKKASGDYEEIKRKRAEAMRRLRKSQKEKENKMPIYQQRKVAKTRREQIRNRVSKHRNKINNVADSSKKKSPFKSAMAYAKATSRVKRALPETPRRSKLICKNCTKCTELILRMRPKLRGNGLPRLVPRQLDS